MDYEKKYKEALEMAKKFHTPDSNNSNLKAVLDLIFPELRESEDERVRKWILDYAIEMIAGLESDISISTYKGIKGHDPDAEAELAQWQKARAYLEKQKEQKPADWSEEDKRKLNRIYEILGHAADDKGFLTSKRIIGDREAIELQDFLKSLRPSWKPSELEKGALRIAIHVLTEERSFPKAAEQLQNILDAFDGKESRQDWKPSEEQEEPEYYQHFDPDC